MQHPVIIVTGASRGLGRAVARALAERGAALVLNARSVGQLAESAAALEQDGAPVAVVAGSVADPAVCAALVATAVARFGRLDAIVNNAAVLEPIAPVAALDLADVQAHLAVNLLGPIALTQAALPHLRAGHGRVINVSSGAAVNPIAGWSAYCAAKAALNLWTRVLAAEEPTLTALAVRPGMVDTPMQQVVREQGAGGMTPERHAAFVASYERGELLPPELPGCAIAALALHAPATWSGQFLAWDEAAVQALPDARPWSGAAR